MFMFLSNKWFVSYEWDFAGLILIFSLLRVMLIASLDFNICSFSKYYVKYLINFAIFKDYFLFVFSDSSWIADLSFTTWKCNLVL